MKKIKLQDKQLDELELELLETKNTNEKLQEELAAAKENIFRKMWRNIV